MRFEELFDDLAAQAAAAGERVLWDEANEMVRAENVSRTLLDRLSPGSRIRLQLRGAHVIEGPVSRVGRDVVVVTPDPGAEWAVRAGAVRQLRLLQAGPPQVRDRVDFSALLRRLARSRPALALAQDDGRTDHGRLLSVGRDHLDIALESAERVLMALDGISALRWRSGSAPGTGRR
ncbi:MAG: hypothetical protein ACTIJJ_06110 [Galactobacter sp.]